MEKCRCGRWRPLVDAEPVREHLKRLQEHNKDWRVIAREAGVPPSVISRVLYGGRDHKPVKRIRAAAAAAILAVTEEPRHLVPAVGARRRIQALVALEHPHAQLAARLNKTRAGLSVLLQRTTITAATDAAVRVLYQQLWDQPPTPTTSAERATARQARRRAQTLCWRGPMDWDDTTPDTPPRAIDEFKQAAARLTAQGLSLRAVGRTLGRHHDQISRALQPSAGDRAAAS